MYKYYGGIDWFEDKPIFLLASCLQNALNKEKEIPNIINMLITGKPIFEENKKMRSKEEILKDYGLEGSEL